jgi:hypothetical protein
MSLTYRIPVLGAAATSAALLLAVSGVFANTPDGGTPAQESVCYELGLEGRAWGLCNAYCEALDCDSSDPKASPKACEWLKNQLEEVAEAASRCEVVECPCFTLEDLEQITTATSCNLSVDTMCDGTRFRPDVVPDTTTVGICDPSYPEGSIVTVSGPYENFRGGAKMNPPLPRRKCFLSTLEKLHACMDLVEIRCDDLGL